MRYLQLISSFACVALGYCVQAQSGQSTSVRPMRQIYVQDQRDRGVLLSDAGEAVQPGATQTPPPQIDDKTRAEDDTKRRSQVRAMLANGQVTTAQDFHDAAFVFQHGDSADDYLLAHVLAIEAVVKGDSSSKWISAATLDRYLQTVGQKQIFGTQYLNERYVYYLQHRNDRDLAEKIKGAGTKETQQPYNNLLIPDTLRLDFCVPQFAQQTLNLQEFNEGRSPKTMIPPGCTR
jgi:hypothetical protein